MNSEASKGIWLAIITGLLAIAGTAAKGIADLRLERAKLDSQLILEALSSPSIDSRRESLRFLVDTDLIGSESTKKGLTEYFKGATPKSPPQIVPFIQSGQSITLTPYTDEGAGKTDVDLFVCESRKADEDAQLIINDIHQNILDSYTFGETKLKAWGGALYKEHSKEALKGTLAIIVDRTHGEYREVPALKEILAKTNNLPPIQVIDNVGEKTPWRISIVLC